MAETINTRVTRLEESEKRAWKAIEALAGRQAKLDDVLTLLAEAQIKTQQEFQKTEQQFQKTDLRIEKLVSAIGEFLRKAGSRLRKGRSGSRVRAVPSRST